MFDVGECVSYGAVGVCHIKDISTVDFGTDGLYYILEPDYDRAGIIYLPVRSVEEGKVRMRKIISRQQATDMIRRMPQVEKLWITGDRERKVAFSEVLASGNCDKWASMMKGLYVRWQERLASKKTISATDAKAFASAERLLYGELAAALGISTAETAEYIAKTLGAGENGEGGKTA